MNAKQFHDELTSLVSRAVKDCDKPKHLTAGQIAGTLAVHANQLNASIQQVQAEQLAKSIIAAPDGKCIGRNVPAPGNRPSPPPVPPLPVNKPA